jgi:hypothetical protein
MGFAGRLLNRLFALKVLDNYVKSLQTADATQGRSTREAELYKQSLRGDGAIAAKMVEGVRTLNQVLGSSSRTAQPALPCDALAGLPGALQAAMRRQMIDDLESAN